MQRFFKFPVQIFHFVGMPLVFMAFILLYRPEKMVELLDMNTGWLDFNVIILSCILLLVLVGTRLAFFFLKKVMKMDILKYAGWCLCEVLIFTAFAAMYLCLMYRGQYLYFPMFARCFLYNFEVLLWPYLVLNLWFMMDSARQESQKPAEVDDMIRFKDENQKLKLAVTAQSLLYIEAKENYVTIAYLDGEVIRKYLLRSSMKRLEETMRAHGLRRCQRAYYVNPSHITVLRKDPAGFVFADLDAPSCPPIPVSKTYYDEIAALL